MPGALTVGKEGLRFSRALELPGPSPPPGSVDLTKGHQLKKALGPQIQGTLCVSAPWLFICPTHLHSFFHWTNTSAF